MIIGHVELPVKDALVSQAYYVEKLGFELVSNQADTFVWVRKGSLELLLRPGSPSPGSAHPDAINLVLYSDDLGTDIAALESRGVQFERVHNCFHFRDPDGYWWQIVNPNEDHSGGNDA